MAKSILDYLEQTASLHGDKLAFVDSNRGITFSQLAQHAKNAAAYLLPHVKQRQPVLVCMDKCVDEIEAFMAVAYAGAFYVPLDIKMPYERMQHILNTLASNTLITRRNDPIPEELKEACDVYYIDDMIHFDGCQKELSSRRASAIDTDPLYSIFTSGSTGMPKGILTSHRAIINFINEFGSKFDFSHEDTLASQIPFYFDASTKDIYLTLKFGCTTYIIPQKLFMMPKQLVAFLNEKQVTGIVWVPSLLCMLANFKVFEKELPQYLKKVFFVGEVMPTKQLNIWRSHLPHIKYVNLYGSSEVTGNNTYYVIERDFDDTETLPIGHPFDNIDVFLLDDSDALVTAENTIGEICVRGTSLTFGYYHNPEKTKEVFVQNPLHNDYPELIYRTGDLGKYNEYGELMYVSRKDHQIKKMGHRIELGEIEATLSPLSGVARVCCVFDEKTQRLLVAYEGTAEKEALEKRTLEALPSYMVPSAFYHMEQLPLNANGKIDRLNIKATLLKEI